MNGIDDVPLANLRLPPLTWKGSLGLVVFPCCLVLFGLWCYAQQRLHGDIVTNMRSVGSGGAAWGVFILSSVFFVGIAIAGVEIATLAHLFRIRELRPLSRLSEYVAVISLVMGALCVMADQGRPLAALRNLPSYANVSSPFFGSFTLIVGVDIAASLVMLYLGGRGDAAWCGRQKRPWSWAYRLWATGYKGSDNELRRHRKARFWLSLVIFPFIVIAFSTLGFIFGIQGGRPGWYGALRAPSLLIVASISGVGAITAIAGLFRHRIAAPQMIPERAFLRLGNALVVLISVFFYILLSETLTERYTGREAEVRVSDAILFGDYAPAYWTMVGTMLLALVMLLYQFVRRTPRVKLMIAVGLLVNVSVLLRRFLVIVPGQTNGHFMNYVDGVYSPNFLELGVLAGICSLGVLALVAFARLFPIVPLNHYHGRIVSEFVPESARRRLTRGSLSALTLLVGLSLAGVGLLYSARFGTESFLDPVLPFSPVIFIVGVVLTLYSAAVYVVAPPG
ncbi:MAG: polysulfide reductase NrfD [Planctomycetes bacterium]|nr:polysulfide reductase NrfD [Planctomycetota bacterium]